jgi:hypothetical protein
MGLIFAPARPNSVLKNDRIEETARVLHRKRLLPFNSEIKKKIINSKIFTEQDRQAGKQYL